MLSFWSRYLLSPVQLAYWVSREGLTVVEDSPVTMQSPSELDCRNIHTSGASSNVSTSQDASAIQILDSNYGSFQNS